MVEQCFSGSGASFHDDFQENQTVLKDRIFSLDTMNRNRNRNRNTNRNTNTDMYTDTN